MSDTPSKSDIDALMCYNIYATHLAFGRFYQSMFADTGFTYPKFLVLMALAEAGPMSLGDLSAKIGVEANTLSPLVKRMSAFGLMDRVRDPEDERRVLLTLKPYGDAVLQEANAAVQAGWASLGLTDAEAATVNTVLRKARGQLEATRPAQTLTVPDPQGDSTDA